MLGFLARFVIRISVFVFWLPLTFLPDMSTVKGPHATWGRSLRLAASGAMASVDEKFGPRAITREERVGSMEIQRESFEMLLWRKGFTRSFLARTKTLEGRPESGSFVYRRSPLAPRQLHIMFWESGDEVEIYAHEEYSSVNPVHVINHFRGEDQRPEKGVEMATEILPKTVKHHSG